MAGHPALRALLVLAASCAALTPYAFPSGRSPVDADDLGTTARTDHILEAVGHLPVTFVENSGQAPAPIRFSARGPGYWIAFTPTAVMLGLERTPSDDDYSVQSAPARPGEERRSAPGLALHLEFVGASPTPRVQGQDRAPGVVNYLIGNDPAGWRTGLPTYGEVAYSEVWPGIGARFRAQGGVFSYEFILAPGARPGDIRLAYRGGEGLWLDENGGLVIDTALGVLRDAPPVTYQVVGGKRVGVDSRYVLDGAGGYGFVLGDEYDPRVPLVIDPALSYSTFLGGGSEDAGSGVAVDGRGNAYVTGRIRSSDFPTTPGSYDEKHNGGFDAFVTKLDPSGSALSYSTFLGGGSTDDGIGLAVDRQGSAYITGSTSSSDFPTTPGAYDEVYDG